MTRPTAYHGPPELTVSRMLTDRHLDAALLAAGIALTAAYTAAVITARRRGTQWPWRRNVA
ncbi:hypothetical protein ACLQ2N_02460 [Streptomyces sp. DT224]|uniref:hypothetical protein n=1 Tax=unclassified Streptomyces TaxID=2593676 RepID=UPI0011CEB08F|nr:MULTISPECIES: hypothetical protein [unclassified Streptomyces]TXS38245.1 hypothetical protein EAO72_34160 [Streptomyces sp. or43]WRZ03584.1 hypothetical protein OG959_09615 [Streptomyces sp. NBC_00385]